MIGLFGDSYYPYVDGVVTCIRNTAYWLNKKYEDTIHFVPGSYKSPRQENFPKYEFKSITIPGYRGFRLGLPNMDSKYKKTAYSSHFSLVHAHSPFMSATQALKISKQQDIPAIATFHSKFYDDFIQYTHSKTFAKWQLEKVVNTFESMDAVFAVSNGTAETLRSYGYKGEIHITPNGCDLLTVPPGSGEKVREMLGLSMDMPIFLFVGQLIIQKNILEIVRAAKLVEGNFRLVMVGDGAAIDTLKKEIASLGIEDKVILPGRINDRDLLAALYQTASAFVFPSLYDNAPLVVREASSMSTPSILAKGSNSAEGFTDGVNAYLREPSAADIAQAMADILSNPQNAARIGAAARNTVHTWEDVTDHLYKEYQAVLAAYRAKQTARSRITVNIK